MSKPSKSQRDAARVLAGIDPFEYAGRTRAELKTAFGLTNHAAIALRAMITAATGRIPVRGKLGGVVSEEGIDPAPVRGEYIRDGEDYVFTWTDATGPRLARLTEDQLKKIVTDYVHDGLDQSMQAAAIRSGLTRRDFFRIKSIYGLTKDHEPFTDRELSDLPEDTLVEDHLASKRRRVMERVEREDYKRTYADAAKWLAFQAEILDPFQAVLEAVVGHVPARTAPQPSKTRRAYITVYQGSDLHYGLFSDARFGGEEYSRDIARGRFIRGLHAVLDDGIAMHHGAKPDYVLLGVGGDMAHVDNVHGTTTSGKHSQDMDGLPDTIPLELTQLYLDVIDGLLHQDIRVVLTCVPGNHDDMMSRQLIVALAAAYRNDSRVVVESMVSSHAYHMYGDTAILFHHGHGEAEANKLAASIAVWLRNEGRTAKHRYAITGNLHHLAAKEAGGAIMLQQPSPAAVDRYHRTNGFEKSRRAVTGFWFSPVDGLLGIRYVGF